MQSNQAMADAMKGVSRVMRSMNARINLPGIQKIMMDFEKESGIMDMKEEMMNDTIDDAVRAFSAVLLRLHFLSIFTSLIKIHD